MMTCCSAYLPLDPGTKTRTTTRERDGAVSLYPVVPQLAPCAPARDFPRQRKHGATSAAEKGPAGSRIPRISSLGQSLAPITLP